jgi:hypothetical protein
MERGRDISKASRINPGETIVLVHFGPCALFFAFWRPWKFFLVLQRPCGQLSYSGDHRKGPQSRGITGLLDMKRLLFALSLARRTGHSVNTQPFDWLYLPRSLLLTIAFSKFEGDPVAATCTAATRRFICRGTLAQRGIGPGCVPTEVGEPAGRLRAAWRAHGR